jgi:hypothetical protein
MRATLGAGWAAKVDRQKRSRLLSRKWVRLVIAATALAVLCGLGSSEIRTRREMARLFTFRQGLTDEKVGRWKAKAPQIEPLANLLHSLSASQMRELARSKTHRLPYAALSAPQRLLFEEALALEFRDIRPFALPGDLRGLDWNSAGMKPAAFYVNPIRSRHYLGSMAARFTGPGIRGEAGGDLEVPR